MISTRDMYAKGGKTYDENAHEHTAWYHYRF